MKTKNDEVLTISRDDFDILLVYAERYAIGRFTYAPHEVCNIIDANVTGLTDNTIEVMWRDISMSRDRDNLGDPRIDAPVWISTLEKIEEEMKRRGI